MPEQEYIGIITKVNVSSAWVKVELDSLPGKLFVWPMAAFLSKPRPEVGKRLVCTARPGAHDELHVQQLISITDLPVGSEPTKVATTVVISSPSVELAPVYKQPVTAPASTLEQLAERILELKAKWKAGFAESLLDFKWHVGQELSVARRATDDESFRVLEAKTGIDHSELHRCVQFYEKYPSHGYELKAWRKVIAELPAGKEPAPETKPTLVVDAKLWTCPTCGIKFEHVHVTDNKHRLQECKAD